jgi:cAMP-dependent protein kinase regulator
LSSERDYRGIFQRAGQRWLEGDAGSLAEYEKGIGVALEQGDLEAALLAHQKLLVWRPGDAALHERVARAIAAARDRAELKSNSSPSLEGMPLFSGVPREELVSLLTSVTPLRFSSGQTVVREGEAGDSLFLVLQGSLRVSTRGEGGQDIALAVLGAGDFLGEVSLLTNRPRTATVTALTDAELLRLDRAAVERLRKTHPQIEASLTEFHRRRAERTVEALIGRRRAKPPT